MICKDISLHSGSNRLRNAVVIACCGIVTTSVYIHGDGMKNMHMYVLAIGGFSMVSIFVEIDYS